MQVHDLGGRSCEIVVYINQWLSKVFHESLSDLALLLRQELGSERHRSYDEIESSLRKMVVP
jgi:hypothetical protein